MKTILIITTIMGGLAVALGAFGAHRLETKLDPAQLDTYQKAVQYHFVHVLALLAVVALYPKLPFGATQWAGYLFIAGIVLFSGSLYLWSSRELLGIEGWRFLVFLTPIGVTAFIAGWISLFISALKYPA